MLLLAPVLWELMIFAVQNQSSSDLLLEEAAQIGGDYRRKRRSKQRSDLRIGEEKTWAQISSFIAHDVVGARPSVFIP